MRYLNRAMTLFEWTAVDSPRRKLAWVCDYQVQSHFYLFISMYTRRAYCANSKTRQQLYTDNPASTPTARRYHLRHEWTTLRTRLRYSASRRRHSTAKERAPYATHGPRLSGPPSLATVLWLGLCLPDVYPTLMLLLDQDVMHKSIDGSPLTALRSRESAPAAKKTPTRHSASAATTTSAPSV